MRSRSIGLIVLFTLSTLAPHFAAHAANGEEKPRSFLGRLVDKATDIFKPREVHFVKPPPEDFFLNPLPSYFNIPTQSQILVMSKELKLSTAVFSQGAVIDPDSHQDLYVLSPPDKELLAFAMEKGGRETAYAAAYDLDAKMLGFTEMSTGEWSSMPSWIMESLFLSAGRFNDRKLIDLVHVHPGYEFVFHKADGGTGGFGSPLSEGDLRETIALSVANPRLYVRIRAIVPNGYSYSMTFLNGNRVFDPIFMVSSQGQETATKFAEIKVPSFKATAEAVSRIRGATEMADLMKLAEESEETRVERVLRNAGIPRTESDYHLHQAAVRSLLRSGQSEEKVSADTRKLNEKILTQRYLEDLGIGLTHPEYPDYEKAIQLYLSMGKSEAEIKADFSRIIAKSREYSQIDTEIAAKLNESEAKSASPASRSNNPAYCESLFQL